MRSDLGRSHDYKPVTGRFQGQKISHDVASGVIQMTVDHFTRANEGTYTVQIHDGKAKAQTSLVLVGDGETVCTLSELINT